MLSTRQSWSKGQEHSPSLWSMEIDWPRVASEWPRVAMGGFYQSFWPFVSET